MALFRIQHSFSGPSGLPDDVYVNTLYVDEFPTVGVTNFEEWVTAVNRFFEAPSTGTSSFAIVDFLGSQIEGNPVVNKVYDMTTFPTGAPDFIETHAAPSVAGNNDAVPAEVALCLSYRTDLGGTLDPRSTRGRIYLGPVNIDALGNGNVPSASFITTILEVATRFQAEIELAGGRWVLYAPSRSTTSTGGTIEEISVDNAWDTQRRRGQAPTQRTRVLIDL